MPGRPARADAFLALNGASYHLTQLRDRFLEGLSNNNQIALFHWHLRGFFWELIAVRDAMRRDRRTDGNVENQLTSMESSDWFREVKAYRNFAHQSFHLVEVAVRDGHAIAFQMQLRDGDGLPYLQMYWNNMRATLMAAYPAVRFGRRI
jgi:hypothetical protein